MIDTKELRIGNLCGDGYGRIVSITTIERDKEWWAEGELADSPVLTADLIVAFEPIPLTEAWLRSFGLIGERSDYRFTLFDFADNHTCSIESTGNKGETVAVYIEQYGEGLDSLPHIKYVHQLQNLYFALTGKELTIKE